ncbi:ABC transporter ATP-binding protein [Cohnella thailandensis]|uniref:ABC transporter ATP-binding protein n=1 Tax=Cohnella thailandensis TaxID=557557 RepID=A0A841SWK1_9BACL|nr:ABC transporter ATP-binding protein [Cohnella thailandensis]MBB6635612.1 ABC transporter ATP-binding protein [Cohnella thailandensis]MBP1974992.1 ABC-2 type transport system ATP-binding protein [Cohnella thailandensis]
MTVAIKGAGITKSYGKRRALDGFDIEVPEYAITAILGPNGAGKSTFMRMLTGMVEPDSGTLTVLGERPSWQNNRRISYLPDRARWYQGHTVEKAIEWGARLLPEFRKDEAWELAGSLGLEADLETEGMSKGQEARLMLALCLAREVPLLILDEPFSGIDMLSREKIVAALIDSFSTRRQTVLICTHEIAETESLFDHAVFVNDGRTALAGSVEDLRAERGSMQDIYRRIYG